MAFIQSWLAQKIQQKEVDMIVDDTLSYLKQRSGLLDPYFPIQTYDSRNFLAYVVERINTIASVIAYGANIPTTAQGRLEKVTSKLLKVGLARVFDENKQWEMLEAMQAAQLKGITVQDMKMSDGSVQRGSANDLAGYIFGNIEDLVRGCMDLLNVLTWQAIQFGEVNFVDYRTNTTTVIDYKDPKYDMFKPALTATGNTVDKHLNMWTDHANADGIQTLFLLVDNFIEVNGFPPDCLVMSRRARNHLLQQQSTKEAARQMMAATQVGTVSVDMLGGILMAREIPTVKTFDEMYQVENEKKEVIKGRFLNENRVVLMAEKAGVRAIGPTLESVSDAMPGINAMPKSGVYVAAEELEKSPPQDALKATATMVPVLLQSRLVSSQQIYT